MNIEAADALNFRLRQPVAYLRPWVDLYYSMQRPAPEPTGRCRNLYPDGGATLQFDFSHQHGVKVSFNLQHTRQQKCFDGPLDCAAVRFKPGGAYALFGLSAAELAGADADALLMKAGINGLCEQLANVREPSQRLQRIEGFLTLRMQTHNTRAGLIQQWLGALPAAPQEIRAQLQTKGIARRKLERAFRVETGFSPGQLYNLHRHKAIRNLLVRQPQLPLSDIALQYGFYDQAHFIRQFTGATGNSPGQYRRRKLSQFYNSN
ncbi:hypothetical protein AT746_14375 [Lacimicrobium alkaliphilum]|uniref:HTH araC/xylS-type domain-containing protein n=2 Tax=Lacimicrobium alkaliphilum TaxID=1526571 RepID=A0A0U3AYY0_9ALTE|nr:hypothetical protein AT746_14375 [Lacimicrobium alkaliphilum]